MIANMGPADYNFDETLSTLRYANRAKNIKNKPKINEDPKDALLRQFQEEIENLKKQLENGMSVDTNMLSRKQLFPFYFYSKRKPRLSKKRKSSKLMTRKRSKKPRRESKRKRKSLSKGLKRRDRRFLNSKILQSNRGKNC